MSKEVKAGKEIDYAMLQLSRLSGLGKRSARRIILQLMKEKNSVLLPLISSLKDLYENVQNCNICHNFDSISPCMICQDKQRDQTTICVIEDVSDLWALEKTGGYNGLYHILNGLISPIDGVNPEDLRINSLVKRIKENQINEVIIALDPTADGNSTMHYLHNILSDLHVKISKPSTGLPVGGDFDFLDQGTIWEAIKSRKELN